MTRPTENSRSCVSGASQLRAQHVTAKAVRAHRFSGSFQLVFFSSSASSPCFSSNLLLGPFTSQHLYLPSLHQFQLCKPILGNPIPAINTHNTISSIVLQEKIIRFKTNAKTI